ncbi:ABC transporter substrate-binding protein [Candidatus Omnitrophota bacterium]
MRKFLSCILLYIFMLSMVSLYGCGSKDNAAGTPVISVWHWMTDRDPTFQELAKKYEEKTGVKVKFDLYAPSDSYSSKVRVAAQGGTLPDIFGILGKKRDFASFVKAGHVLNLSPYMDADMALWRRSFFEKALAVNEFKEGNSYGAQPGLYGVPLDVMTIQMVYNKDLFEQLGIDPESPPSTFAEFIKIGAKIKEAKMQGLVSGWAEPWMIDCLSSNYALSLMGRDKVLATIRGEVPYTDAAWIRVLGLFKDMRESGVLAEGIVAMVNKRAERLFANDKAVFAFNGSWCVNVYQEMNPDLRYGVMLPPEISDDFPMVIWGGAGSSFMVNARSARAGEAVKFLRWLSSKEQQSYLSEATNNLPANKQSAASLPKINALFARGMDHATHPNAWDVSEFSMVTETWSKGIQSIILGEKTPEQVATETQAVKERELARKRK